ncbi:putative CCR4-associated factor 1-like protein 11 isoform X1 [Gossypium australe]|uniref:Putative CCR4-associated factor 1-like protein 11 isoform X1 n=1 Tax=Gossypium australe TaxID=47621 RepID=A0A5B6WMQ5_9ROSI|nr:putative CCR4-associated factor 1-like protein 11 isoform X1 [Gossypium australe]
MSIFGNKSIVVRRVFAEDLDSEFSLIKAAILRYWISGTIFKPNKQVIREGNPVTNCHYKKSNVNALQIIQLGLSLSDARSNLLDFDSPFSYIWKFNFRDFDINRDCYASDLVELLKRQGIDFEKNEEKGIDSKDFAKKLWEYGLVFNCYDLKNSYSKLTAFASSLIRGSIGLFLRLQRGLEKIAQTLNVAHITGSSYQAGSNSLLTLQYFMKLKSENIFESKWNKTN